MSKKDINVKVTGVRLTITDGLRDAAESYAKSIMKHCDEDSTIYVTLKVDGPRKIAEVVATCDGRPMRVEKENKYKYNDLYDTLASAFDTLDTKMSRYRGKRSAYKQESIRFAEVDDTEVENGPQIVRVKTFTLKPMSPDEACLQMEMLGHDFFVFKDEKEGNTCVVYRRNDGNYGLIKP